MVTNRAQRRATRETESLDNAERLAAGAAERAANEGTSGIPDEITLKNGVRFKLKPVPPLLVRKAARNVPRPVVPTVWIEDKQRDEENPNDPLYLAAMDEFYEASGLAALDVVIIAGLEILDIPEGVPPPQSNDWIETLEAVGLATEFKSDKGRFLEWVKSVALADVSDYVTLQAVVTRFMGVNEGDVIAAIDSFRDNGQGPAANGASPAANNSNGNRVRAVSAGDSSGG